MPANQYNSPPGTQSSVGPQIRTDSFYRKALIEIAKEQYFSKLADVRAMPKHHGKTIKQFHYIPILDDANVNDQGIDASGTSTTNEITAKVTFVSGEVKYIVGNGANAAAALADLEAKTIAWATSATAAGGLGLAVVAQTYAAGTLKTLIEGAASVTSLLDTNGVAITSSASAVAGFGNIYGSSKNVGDIVSKLPSLTEAGGRVNRVGFKRKTIESTIQLYGFFDEYTKESLDFDTDEALEQHIVSESLKAANEIYEDQLQVDLLQGAGVVRFTGLATSTATLSGEANRDILTYDDIVKLSLVLDRNRTPVHTKIISGSRMIDTKIINAARYCYIGPELVPTLMKLADYFGNQAFIPVAKYANSTTVMHGEVGSIDKLRFIVHPEMARWEGAGGTVTSNPGYHETGGKYDVFPMLVVGDGSFTTIGFMSSGKGSKFTVNHVKPGELKERNDPYGMNGFYAIQWYFGTMILRPERLVLIKTIATV